MWDCRWTCSFNPQTHDIQPNRTGANWANPKTNNYISRWSLCGTPGSRHMVHLVGILGWKSLYTWIVIWVYINQSTPYRYYNDLTKIWSSLHGTYKKLNDYENKNCKMYKTYTYHIGILKKSSLYVDTLVVSKEGNTTPTSVCMHPNTH